MTIWQTGAVHRMTTMAMLLALLHATDAGAADATVGAAAEAAATATARTAAAAAGGM